MPVVHAQFRFQDASMDQAAPQQNDPLRRVFGIMSRLLNRMSQQSPPTDDELHLKGINGVSEADSGTENLLGPEGPEPKGMMPPRAFGNNQGGTGNKMLNGANRIIDETKLNQLLPRLNPNSVTTTTMMMTTTQTNPSSTNTTNTNGISTTQMPINPTTTTGMALANTKRTVKRKRRQRTKKTMKKNSTVNVDSTITTTTAAKTSEASTTEAQTTTTMAQSAKNAAAMTNGTMAPIPAAMTATTAEEEPLASSTTRAKSTERIPPMSILKPEEEDVVATNGKQEAPNGGKNDGTQLLGATYRLGTVAAGSNNNNNKGEKGMMDASRFFYGGVNKGNNNESTMLARMENETAQLISEIETVLADAEIGPNGGHWLRVGEEDSSSSNINMNGTMMPTTTMAPTLAAANPGHSSTTTSNGSEEEEEEGDHEIGDEHKGNHEDDSNEVNDDNNDDVEEEGEEGGSSMNSSTTGTTTTTASTTPTNATSISSSNFTTAAIDDATLNSNGTKMPLSPKKKGAAEEGAEIAEAEEEEQAGDIAQLQLDFTPSLSTIMPSTSPANQSAAAAGNNGSSTATGQNIFNLNTNANANSNPNFATMIQPVNTIIDGIGPLILPLIGYSRQAIDAAYAPPPFSVQRANGVSIFRPESNGLIGQQKQQPEQQQQQPTPILHGQQQSVLQQQQPPWMRAVARAQRPFVPSPSSPNQQQLLLYRNQQLPLLSIPAVQIPPPKQQQPPASMKRVVPDPPSLELLGRIIEQRRQREREATLRLQEISGSSPPGVEQEYFPPRLDRQQQQPIPVRPAPSSQQALTAYNKATLLAAGQQSNADQGYDAGRRSVQSTFHEDSGLMLGQQPATNPLATTNGGGAIGAALTTKGGGVVGSENGGGGNSGFGGGRRPTGEVPPFLFAAS